jgi:RNA polymerase sigma-70 factor, ECF subfamily
MMDREPNEYELALRARDGDREALSELLERARLRLFALAYAELGHYEDAQDVVAAAVLQICRHVGELRQPERVRGWMQSIVRNEARLRRRQRAAEPAAGDEAERASAADDSHSLLRLDVECALRRLPRDEARAITLFYLGDVPIREIARRTGRPEGTIKRWLHFGRRRLAVELEEYAPMKRRDALKLLAATPALATTLGECAAMTPKPAVNAAIISTDLEPKLVRSMADAARAAGFDRVITLDALPSLEATGEGDARENHLPESLKGVSVVVLDEWIGGRSAFEILAILKAAAESKEMAFFMLASAPRDSTVFAAWASGVDCFLTKPFDLAEFQKFMKHLRIHDGASGEARARHAQHQP